MRVKLTSVFVDDQAEALRFYTEVLDLIKKTDLPAGRFRRLTVVSPEGPDDLELLLEPNANPAAEAYQRAIYEEGIPATSFLVDDLQAEYDRLTKLGVVFRTAPMRSEWGLDAVFDDTCGNFIGLHQI